MTETAKQVIALCRHEQVLAEMNARQEGMKGTMAFVAETLEMVTGPINGLVVRVRGPGGQVHEADGTSGCQALASLLTTGGVGNMICAAMKARVGSDPSAAVGRLAQVAAQAGVHSRSPVPAFGAAAPHGMAQLQGPPPTNSYPAGTVVTGSQSSASYPAGTMVNSATDTHRYPSGTTVQGAGTGILDPANFAPSGPVPGVVSEAEVISAPPVAAPPQGSWPTMQPPQSALDGAVAAAQGVALSYEELGRLVAHPDIKLRLQGPDDLKGQIRGLIAQVTEG